MTVVQSTLVLVSVPAWRLMPAMTSAAPEFRGVAPSVAEAVTLMPT